MSGFEELLNELFPHINLLLLIMTSATKQGIIIQFPEAIKKIYFFP